MLKSNITKTTNNLIVNSLIELGDDLAAETKGKGRKFISKFIEPGVAHYDEFGDVLITKETLDKFIRTMVGCPVIIKHKDISDKNADKERVGVISNVWFNEMDGWYYCDGIIWDKQAIDLVKNQGWSVSCTYDFESDKKPKTHNGKKIDMEFTDGEFLHLALVDNPRYERANIVMNSKEEALFTVYNESDQDLSDTSKDRWITIKPNGDEGKGRPLLIKAGQTVDEAIKEKFQEWAAKSSRQQKLFDVKEYSKSKEEIKKDREEQKKADKLHQKISDIEDLLYLVKDKQTREILEKDLKNLKESKPEIDKDNPLIAKETSIKEEQLITSPEDLKQVAEKKGVAKRDVKPEDIGLGEEKKELSEHEKIFGEGVEVQEHDRKGYMVDSKNLKSYKKGDKFAIVDDWSHEDKERYTVSFHDGKKTLNRKTYSTKRGMEKAIREHLQGGANKETKALETKTDLNAAQERYKDVLNKYNEADRKRWQSDISPAEYHKAWADAEKYKKELTTARREYAESIMSNFEKSDVNPYEERQAARRERYEELSDKAKQDSNRAYKSFSDGFEGIPFGQPIIGQRDANYRQKLWQKADKAYELSKKSDYYERKAGSVGKAGISADDANAIAKLAEKYKSGVDSAEKRRIIDRVIDLHKRSTSSAPASETTDYGFKIERNKDINRLQLKFDGKPDEKTRTILKSNGFRWSPREGAWQRQLNGNSEYSLNRVIEKMKAENSLYDGLSQILDTEPVTKRDIPILKKIKKILNKFQ